MGVLNHIFIDTELFSCKTCYPFLEVIQVIRGHLKVKHWICCCYCIPWVPSFGLISIKAIVKIFYLWRSLEVIRVHQKVKHWICCCYCIPGVPRFYLICIKTQLNIFIFRGHLGHSRSSEVIRRSNTGCVAATVFPGFLAFV